MTIYEILTIISLAMSLLWPLYQLYLQLFGGTLKIRLTRNIFFRLNETGESIFVKPILLAEHGNVLVQNVKANLIRTDKNAKKHWNIEFLQFGELVRNQDHITSDHFFYSSSPLSFITNNKPERAVYHGRVEQYATAVEDIIVSFRAALNTIKSRTPTTFIPGEEEKMKTAITDLVGEVKKTTDALKNKIQLEEGAYRVDLTIEYVSIGRLINCQRKAKSSVSFTIERDARDKIINNVPSTLFTIGRNLIFNEQSIVNYPEYQPCCIIEL